MICAHCRMVRIENQEPCPHCDAPIPSAPYTKLFQFSPTNAVPQIPFEAGTGLSPLFSQEEWGQQGQQEQSMLPVPYQGNMGLQTVSQPQSLQLAPGHESSSLEEGMVYIPPMYTKPRPIIPRYRIISGLLSVLIVTILFCSGASYYAKASGKLEIVQRVIAGNEIVPGSLRATELPTLPDPPDTIDQGPAANIITSATTTAHLISDSSVASQTDKVFKPNQVFYVTYSIQQQKERGTLLIKWYTNKLPYSSIKSDIAGGPAENTLSGNVKMSYSEPSEGMVELYWNDKLAKRLYFVVRN